jgi:translation initiation factor IF-2
MATIEVEDMITVGILADKLMIPVTRLIGELMKNGIMATVNEQIDFDTAQIIVSELGLDVSLERQSAAAQSSAYQIDHNGRKITFLDTPGHEAFASIREHSAHLTDIALIVVAADDGIKPQTLEAIRFARKAGVKMIIAINKIDKEGANPNLVKQQLAEQQLLVEEWGGDTIVVELSALAGKGVPELLDMILLMA